MPTPDNIWIGFLKNNYDIWGNSTYNPMCCKASRCMNGAQRTMCNQSQRYTLVSYSVFIYKNGQKLRTRSMLTLSLYPVHPTSSSDFETSLQIYVFLAISAYNKIPQFNSYQKFIQVWTNSILELITVMSYLSWRLNSPENHFLFRLISKRTLLANCEKNPSITGGFPSQRASNAESVLMSWRHVGWWDIFQPA